MNRAVGWVFAFGLPLLVVLLSATYFYVQVMYDGQVSQESLIEGGSFAAQTITTVGYGNWEHPARAQSEHGTPEERENRILRLRAWSIVFMLAGATFYTLLTGVFVAGFTNANR